MASRKSHSRPVLQGNEESLSQRFPIELHRSVTRSAEAVLEIHSFLHELFQLPVSLIGVEKRLR